MLGCLPSDLTDFFDFNRFAELLCDTDQEPVTTGSALDALPRAKNIVAAAENLIVQACRTRDTYSLQELRDLVRDYHLPPGTISGTGTAAHEVGLSGQQLIMLVADLSWCRAMKRKRWVKDSPQGQDPACEDAEAKLDQIRAGDRIFVMQGVEVYDLLGNWTGGWYGTEAPDAGVIQSGNLNTHTGLCAPRLFGCDLDKPRRSGSGFCCD